MDVINADTLHLGKFDVHSNQVPATRFAKQIVPAVSTVCLREEAGMVMQDGSFHDSLSDEAVTPLVISRFDAGPHARLHRIRPSSIRENSTQY